MSDVFGNPNALHLLWHDLKTKFDDGEVILGPKTTPMIVLCYDGESSQIATSLLRARGYIAFSVSGGFPALHKSMESRRQGRRVVRE